MFRLINNLGVRRNFSKR